MGGQQVGQGILSSVVGMFVGLLMTVIGVTILFTSGMSDDLKTAIAGFEDEPVEGVIEDKHVGAITQTKGNTSERSTWYRYSYVYDGEEYKGTMDIFNERFEVGDTIGVKVGKSDRAYSKEENQKMSGDLMLPLIVSVVIGVGVFVFILGALQALKYVGLLGILIVAIRKNLKRNKEE